MVNFTIPVKHGSTPVINKKFSVPHGLQNSAVDVRPAAPVVPLVSGQKYSLWSSCDAS